MISASQFINNPFEGSIQQILRLDAMRKESLSQEVKEINKGKDALDSIGSAFSAFQTILQGFEEDPGSSFQPLQGHTTSDHIQLIAVDATVAPGNYSIQVEHLAKNAIVNSMNLANTGTELSATGTGQLTFSVGDEVIEIDMDTQGLTNQEVMDQLAAAIADKTDAVHASRLRVSDSESVFSLKSRETGSSSQITLQHAGGDFAQLNLDPMFASEELDATFILDGVTFTRPSNLIHDVVEGLEFELTGEDNQLHQIQVTRNTEEAQNQLESFVDAYNKLNKAIRDNTRLTESGQRGPLQRERSIRQLSGTLRQSLVQPVLAGGEYLSLQNAGIEFDSDGTMKISDPDQLESMITSRPDMLNQLFNSPDGLSVRIRNGIEQSFEGKGSLLDTIDTGMDSRIDRLNNRIERENRFLERREAQLRQEFSSLLQIIEKGQSQFNQVLQYQSWYA